MNYESVLNHLTIDTDTLIAGIKSDQTYVDMVVGQGTDSIFPILHIRTIDSSNPPEEGEKADIKDIVCGIDIDINDPETKQQFVNELGKRLSDARRVPIMILFVSEAWQVTTKDPEEAGRPAEHPDREEVIMVSGITINPPNELSTTLPVTRDADNNFVPGEWTKITKANCNLLTNIVVSYARYLNERIEKRSE